MQKLLVALQYACLAFGLYVVYSVAMDLYTQQFEMMELVADVGTILICIDLAVFLYGNRGKQGVSMQGYAQQLEQKPSKLVYVTRKLGHLGILLIITSWIVPNL